MKPERELISDEASRALTLMQTTTQQLKDRYETGLIWRTDDIHLPESYTMARRRLYSVESKMRRDPAYGKLYNAQIKSNIEKDMPVNSRPKKQLNATNEPGTHHILLCKTPISPECFDLCSTLQRQSTELH